METLSESILGNEIRDAIKHAQETGQPVEIADELGHIVAHLIPARDHANSPAWTELDRLIDAISPHLPEYVDAVEAIRDVRR